MVDKEYSNLTIQFVSWVIQRDHVEYQINLFNDKISAEFTQRYSSLRNFHDAIRIESRDPNFPKFPPKKYFGNTDKQFLNQRMVGLQHYFSCVLLSKDFSNLKNVKNWVTEILKKYGKIKVAKESSAPMEQSNNNKPDEIIEKNNIEDNQYVKKNNSQSLIIKRKDIAEKYCKNFIELSGDNVPTIDEEYEKREKAYISLLKTANIYDSNLTQQFSNLNGRDENFSSLGKNEDKGKYEADMLSKLEKLSHEIYSNIPSYYMTNDFIVSIPISQK